MLCFTYETVRSRVVKQVDGVKVDGFLVVATTGAPCCRVTMTTQEKVDFKNIVLFKLSLKLGQFTCQESFCTFVQRSVLMCRWLKWWLPFRGEGLKKKNQLEKLWTHLLSTFNWVSSYQLRYEKRLPTCSYVNLATLKKLKNLLIKMFCLKHGLFQEPCDTLLD